MKDHSSRPLYHRIYDVVRMIPKGKVATYGQVARITGRCSARNVGYAMSFVPYGSDIPWHRVINSRGCISTRSSGEECPEQRTLLRNEEVHFNRNGKVDLEVFGWEGPFPEDLLF